MNKAEFNLLKYSYKLFDHIAEIIGRAQKKVAISLNTETTLLYWSIGNYINTDLKVTGQVTYGSRIIATLSQQLSWSHLIELATISDFTKREFYILLCSEGNTEHKELLMLDDKSTKVAQYLTEFPSKKWFAQKLHRALELVKMNNPNFE